MLVNGQGPDPHGRNVVSVVDGFQWIEGVGNTAGLMAPNEINISGSMFLLECMSHADTIHYPWERAGECAPYNAVNEWVDRAWSVFPNPANEVLYVDHRSGGGYYRILDLAGQKVTEGALFNGRNAITLERLAPGTYALVSSADQGTMSTRFVRILP